MINGKVYSWEDIAILGISGIFYSVQSINYSDERGVEEVYGKGSNVLGHGRQNYKAGGSFSILKDEQKQFEAAMLALSGTKGFFNHKPTAFTVSYADEDMPTHVDVLVGVRITKRDQSVSQGDAKVTVQYDFTCTEIRSNALPSI